MNTKRESYEWASWMWDSNKLNFKASYKVREKVRDCEKERESKKIKVRSADW